MSSYNFQLSGARLSDTTVEEFEEFLRDPGAPAPITPQYNQRLPYNEPHGPAEVAALGAMPNQVYRRPTPTRTTTLGVASQVPVDAGDLIEAVAVTQGNRHKRRGGLPREGVPSNRKVLKRKIAKKVDQACLRCRKNKQRCDGGQPRCRRCGQHRACIYAPTQRQIDLEQAARDAESAPDFSRQIDLVEAARGHQGKTHSLAPRLRSILPRPEAPNAVVGGLVAGPDEQVYGTSGGPGEFLGAAAGGSYGVSQQPHQPDPMPQVRAPSPIGLPLNHHDEAAIALGGYQPQLSGYFPAPAVPNFALGGSMVPPNQFTQSFPRPEVDLEGYPPQASAPLPTFQGPGFVEEESMGGASGSSYDDHQPEAEFEGYLPRTSALLLPFGGSGFELGESTARPLGIPQFYHQPEAEFEDYLPLASAPLPPFRGSGFELGGPTARPLGIPQYFQRPEAQLEGYSPRVSATLPPFGGPGFVLGESTAPPNGIPQYQLGGYPTPVSGPRSSLGAPDLARGESVAQLMNSDLDTEYIFSDFSPPSTGGGLWPEFDGIGANHLDEQAAVRDHFAELDAMGLPGRQQG